MKNTSSELLDWYHLHKRDLPWRKTRDPYLIWLSEVILQQTRVDQGLAYYQTFSKKYPKVQLLAKAPSDEVMKLWQGLGYYSRARNLHAAAKEIVATHKGQFPRTYEDIRALKGVGDYTAAAIASFAYDMEYPVLDGNVFRFLSRYFGIRTPIDSTAAKKEFREVAATLMKGFPPHDFNQAIMEFGARQCKPVNPDCGECPLMSSCFAFENKCVDRLPVKEKKTKVSSRYFHYLVIREGNSVYLKKRTEKDIWLHLYDFPLIETKTKTTERKLFSSAAWKKFPLSGKLVLEKVSREYKHQLSHQTIHACFYELKLKQPLKSNLPDGWKKTSRRSLASYALPRLIELYLSKK